LSLSTLYRGIALRSFSFLLLVFLLAFSVPVCAAEQLRLSFFDVGEGDCLLIESDGHSALIDTGNLHTGPGIIPKLKKSHVEKIDSLILTHPHLDHIGGVFALLTLIPVFSIYDNGEDLKREEQTDDIYRWYTKAVRSNSRYKALKRGDVLTVGKASLFVLWPPSPLPTSDWNSNSLVIMLRFGKFSALFMGDGNIETERLLINSGSSIKANVLKAGHHGAQDTGSPEFIKAVSPQLIVISIDHNNKRKYPSPETLARFQKSGAGIIHTSKNGDVVIVVSEDGRFSVL
jgi:competence protein ComEC